MHEQELEAKAKAHEDAEKRAADNAARVAEIEEALGVVPLAASFRVSVCRVCERARACVWWAGGRSGLYVRFEE